MCYMGTELYYSGSIKTKFACRNTSQPYRLSNGLVIINLQLLVNIFHTQTGVEQFVARIAITTVKVQMLYPGTL